MVDVSNSPSFADEDVMNFFATSTTNLLAAEKKAGVRHHVALSVVGTGTLPDSGYLRAKAAQEDLIGGRVPYSIVRATQFFEFTRRDRGRVHGRRRARTSPPVHFQPIASDDVARAVSRVAVRRTAERRLEIGGPERVRMDEFIAAALATSGDTRDVVVDEHARYFGTELADDSLVPGPGAQLGATSYETWVKESA